MNPFVSVILPTFNGARYLSEAIESVLSQTGVEFELLIIDDGSGADTQNVLSKFLDEPRILMIRHETNLGLQCSLNDGLRQAKGKYIARIDDDDAWIGIGKLAEQVQFLEKHPDYVLVGTGVIVTDADGKERSRFFNPETDESIRQMMLKRPPFAHPSVVFRKDVVLGLGGYSEDPMHLYVEDYELWLRLGVKGKLANLPIYALKHRVISTAISEKNRRTQIQRSFVILCAHRYDYPGFYWAQIRSQLKELWYLFP